MGPENVGKVESNGEEVTQEAAKGTKEVNGNTTEPEHAEEIESSNADEVTKEATKDTKEVNGHTVEPENVDKVESNGEVTEEATKETEEVNGNTVEPEKVEQVESNGDEITNSQAEAVNEDAPAKPQSQHAKTVANILQRVKNDDSMTPDEKSNTLSLLLAKFVEENGVLKNEVDIILENMKRHVEHKNTLKMMNDALKRQVDLVKEECELKLKEELAKRQESVGGYSDTMGELSTLLETQA